MTMNACVYIAVACVYNVIHVLCTHIHKIKHAESLDFSAFHYMDVAQNKICNINYICVDDVMICMWLDYLLVHKKCTD